MFWKIDRKYWLYFVLVLVLWLIIPQFFIRYTPWFSGAFGVTKELEAVFAPVNALFSGLAFAILIITIFQQQQTIESQQNLSYKQSFESNFFHLISIHKKNLDEIKCDTKDIFGERRKLSGRNSFRFFYRALYTFYCVSIGDVDDGKGLLGKMSPKQIESVKNLDKRIKKLCEDSARHNVEQAHYYIFLLFTKEILSQCHRHIYHIIKYIDESSIPEDEKMKYIRILRAQFNNYEFVILFYSSLQHREDKFKKMIEKYAFFHNLNKGLLFKFEDQMQYESSAYGDKGYEDDVNMSEMLSRFDMSDY